jgi:hypothetical protein
LLGDVLAARGHPAEAVQTHVVAGEAKKAASLAAALPETVDVRVWVTSAVRCRRAAAAQVIGAQAAILYDDDVPSMVETLLQAAEGLWESPGTGPYPEIDALKAVASFGVRIPETATDGILAAAGPALTANTGASDTIANLLVQTYWAIESRRQDLADALRLMLLLPHPPYNLWGLVRNMPPPARTPLLPMVRALADEGRDDAIRALATWRQDSGVVQLAARRACAALLRRPVGIERIATTVGTHESTTADLLLALLDADELVDVDTSELGIDKARPAGGHRDTADAEIEQDTPGDGASAVPSPNPATLDPTSNAADNAALIAAGSPGELAVAVAVAVAKHLMAMAEDRIDGAASRAQAVSAVRRLVDRLPAVVARQLAVRLAAVHQAPGLSEAVFEIRTDTPFSRTRFNTHARDLAGLTLLTSAEAFRAGRGLDAPVTDADRAFVDRAAASAAMLLRDDERSARQMGALTITAIAAVPEFSGLTTGLLFHSDEHVRALGAAQAPASAEMFAVLATDPAPRVRAAVAGRTADLPETVRRHLASDPHLVVRRGLADLAEQDKKGPAEAGETDTAEPSVAPGDREGS